MMDVAEESDKLLVKVLLGLVKKSMFCVRVSVMLCWRILV